MDEVLSVWGCSMLGEQGGSTSRADSKAEIQATSIDEGRLHFGLREQQVQRS